MEQITIVESEGRQPQHTNCMRCRRALKNTRSRGIGFGPICERKAVADARAVKEATMVSRKLVASDPKDRLSAFCEVA